MLDSCWILVWKLQILPEQNQSRPISFQGWYLKKNLSSLTEIGVGRFKQWWKPENSCIRFSFFKLVGVSNSERNLVTGWRDLKKCPFTYFTWGYLRADTEFQKFHLRKLHQRDWGIFYSDAKCMSLDICMEFYQPYLYSDALSVRSCAFFSKWLVHIPSLRATP